MHELVCSLCKWLVKLTLSVLACGVTLAATAGAAEPACSDGGFRDFDFWLGQWEVVDANGVMAGHNHIESAQQGCVLVEQWRGAQGSTGTSLNYFDPAAGQWHQVWVSPATLIDISGALVDGRMELVGSIVYLADGRTLPFRGTWTALPDGRVRQRFDEQHDDGEWALWFDGYYQRTDAPPPDAGN